MDRVVFNFISNCFISKHPIDMNPLGKTLIAKAIAGEAGVPFIYCAASEFDEMLVGVGARRVRALFQEARSRAPCIIFIDEIDSLAKRRKDFESPGEKTLNQILSLMDGFEKNSGVVVIGATNHPDSLDPALKRSGRFDKEISVPIPDSNGRMRILKYYLDKVVSSSEIDDDFVQKLARLTTGMTGADLANLVNQAAVRAATKDQAAVMKQDLDAAYDDVLLGSERKGTAMTEKQKWFTAVREGGHAIVAWGLKDHGSYPIRKVSILPRGISFGHVSQTPDDDQVSFSRQKMLANIAVAMGGRAAEKIVFGKDKLTTGTSDALSRASSLATEMVVRWGMSKKFGPRTLMDAETIQDVSGETNDLVDDEIAKILFQQEQKAFEILKKYANELRFSSCCVG